jgi:hypothetical protein
MDSNLSKTKPAFRTKGAVTGNFGAGKRTGGSKYNEVPSNRRESLGNFPTKDDYRKRLKLAFRITNDPRLQDFILGELAELDRQEQANKARNPEGAYCALHGHHVTSAQ